MGATAKGLPYPEPAEPADGPTDIRELAEACDKLLAPVGSPFPWLVSAIPAGYLEFNGQAISAGTYPKLAALYGANLPDLRGKFLFGADASRPPGAGGGEETHLLSAGESGMPAHTFTPSSGQRINQQPSYASGGNVPVPPGYEAAAGPVAMTYAVNVPAQGASSAHNNMPPFRAVRWITAAG
jgi:microcystin-dependent protein